MTGYAASHASAASGYGTSHGETVALLGPNGAGKSTSLDMLLALRKPTGTLLVYFAFAILGGLWFPRDGFLGHIAQ